jgi:hypothetical protein
MKISIIFCTEEGCNKYREEVDSDEFLSGGDKSFVQEFNEAYVGSLMAQNSQIQCWN